MTNELREFGETCRRELTENILPFWMQHGWDREHGGGGIISFWDCRGLPPQCCEQDMKFWWPRMLVKCAELCKESI